METTYCDGLERLGRVPFSSVIFTADETKTRTALQLETPQTVKCIAAIEKGL